VREEHAADPYGKSEDMQKLCDEHDQACVLSITPKVSHADIEVMPAKEWPLVDNRRFAHDGLRTGFGELHARLV
jgi:hypothetical protein